VVPLIGTECCVVPMIDRVLHGPLIDTGDWLFPFPFNKKREGEVRGERK